MELQKSLQTQNYFIVHHSTNRVAIKSLIVYFTEALKRLTITWTNDHIFIENKFI